MPESDAIFRLVAVLGLGAFAVATILDAILTHGPRALAILSTRIEGNDL